MGFKHAANIETETASAPGDESHELKDGCCSWVGHPRDVDVLDGTGGN